jgi:hypothetical protein
MLKRILVSVAALAAVAAVPAAAAADGLCPPSPSAVWTTGLEHGIGTLSTPNLWWSNTGATVDDTVARSGRWSLRSRRPDYGWVSYAKKETWTHRQVLSFALRLDTLPAGDVSTLFKAETNGTDLFLGFRDSDDRLTLRWGAGGAVASSIPVVEKTWFTIDLRLVTGANPMTADWSVSGVPQESTSISELSYQQRWQFGSDVSGDAPYTAHFDDILQSHTASDYPIGPQRVLGLRPNSGGAHAGAANFRDDDGTVVDPLSWTRLDDQQMHYLQDGHVRQVVASGSSSLEFGFDDTLEPCIDAVQALFTFHKTVAKPNYAKTSVFDGGVERVVYAGDVPNTNVAGSKTLLVQPALGAWTPAAVNALTMRLGYSTDVSPEPIWDALLFEMAVPG